MWGIPTQKSRRLTIPGLISYPCHFLIRLNSTSAFSLLVIGILIRCFYGEFGTSQGVQGFFWPSEFPYRSSFKKPSSIKVFGPIADTFRHYSTTFGNCTEEDVPKPYRNRSIAWTQRYRSVVPYDTARKWVMELGLRSKAEWDEYVEDGKVFHRSYLPNHPDEMYADEWVSWEEFLGLMRSYNDTRNIVQNVLRIHTLKEYSQFIAMNPKRAEGLRIPAKPWIVYREQWVGEEDFFGTWK